MLAGLICLSASSALAQSTVPPATKPGDVVVEPTVSRPKPPDGDPRTNDERREDRAAFDKCLLKMQGRPEETLSSPGLAPDPMMYCQQRLGMANAYDVPQQTRARQH
ncbi:MAG: hypothetical protein WDN76_02070 [Alphaproteobacteria bacterium]